MPARDGPLPVAKAIGIVRVSRCRATVAGVPCVRMMSGCRPTNSCAPYPMSLDISWWIRRNDFIEPRCFRATVSVESPSEITVSTVERVRASRSKGLARAAVIAGVGRYLEDVFRPEEGIPDAPIAVANRSSTRRHWLGGLYAGLGYMGQEQTGRPHRYEVGPTPLPKCCVMWIAKLPVHGAGLVSRSCTTSLDRY